MTKILLAWTLSASGAALLAAQTPSSPTQQPSFRTLTTLVEIDTIVTDRKGQFVRGLAADDFEVYEDGKPQKIERVDVVTGSTVTAQPSATETPTARAAAQSVVPTGAGQRVFVLFFDSDHLQEGAFHRLRDAAIAFLTTEFRQGDVGGVVIGTTMAGNRLTSDRDALVTAVREAKPSAAKTSRRLELLEWPRLNSEAEAIRIGLSNDREVLAEAVRRACADDPSVCKKVDPEPMLMEKARMILGDLRPAARRTVITLQTLASGLARLPGRKTIVLMTEGFFVEESWADLRQIVGASARSDVRIYAIDARGVDTRHVNDPRQLGVMDPGGSLPLEAYNTSEDGPNMLAVDTGGYTIRHTNAFADALAEIARDTSTYYVIGYRPVNPVLDGSFRKIAVRVTRSGLSVRARRGYLATPMPAQSTSAPSDVGTTAPARPEPVPVTAGVAEAATPTTDVSMATTPAATPAAADVKAAAAVAAPAPTVRLRPDSVARVRDLAAGENNVDGASLAARGWERYQKGDLEGAAEFLRKAAVDQTAAPWVRYALGYAELGLRRPREAAETWEKVRGLVPEFRAVYLDLADAYFQLENYGRALEVLRSAESRWPGDAEVLNAAGTIQVRRGALDDAIKTFQRATLTSPDDALAYFNLGRTNELRYFKMRRYSPNEGRWLSNPADVKNAIACYERYVKLGGPYESQAREAMQNLQWIK
jgi:VWFA-related protein